VGGFSLHQRISRTRVFNTFVENAVEIAYGDHVSHSARDASAFCTEESAGTFVVEAEKVS
jgi:hypothetical protein